MEWNNLKDQYREIIQNQLTTDPVKGTIEFYQQLLENGYEEQQAIDKLIPYLHDQVLDTLGNNQTFNKDGWYTVIEPLKKDDIRDLEYLDKRQLERLLKRIRKEFGYIKQGDEDSYLEGLYAFENNLSVLSNRYGLNSRQLEKIVKAWIVIMYGYYRDSHYDLSSTIDDDLIEMTKPLIYNSNPYINDDLKEQFLKDHPDADLLKDKESIYTMNFRLLGRVLDSIQFWNKEYGSNGYLTYLNKFMNEGEE